MGNSNDIYTILLVSDSRVHLNATMGMIKRLGYVVLIATNGTDASRIFQHNKDVINLAMLDLNWADELGPDTCLKLKEIDSGVKTIHICELGSHTTNESLDCGCSGLLVKPVTIEELSIKLIKMLGNRPTRSRLPICKETLLKGRVYESQRKVAAG